MWWILLVFVLLFGTYCIWRVVKSTKLSNQINYEILNEEDKSCIRRFKCPDCEGLLESYSYDSKKDSFHLECMRCERIYFKQ